MSICQAVLLIAIQFSGCSSPGPADINYGQDQCTYCKMTIADKRFGAELVTHKGKIYKFDSIECLAAFQLTGGDASKIPLSMWVTDFSQPGTFLNVDQAAIIAAARQKSPMGVGLVAVATSDQAKKLIEAVGGNSLNWEQIRSLVSNEWHL
jgi:copper chaperone NosL